MLRTLLLILLFAVCSGLQAAPVVKIQQGDIKGTEVNGVRIFKGIPFAQPPIDDLRWQPPRPVSKYAKKIDAVEFGPACLQTTRPGRPVPDMSEDCLTLNIWSARSREKQPVMVWIHGGGFRAGSGNIPGEVFAEHGVVVVSLNYRLGPLGFFAHPSLEGKAANFGMMDMILALQWVQQNIARFDGDKDNVTIFGASAGGMAVNLLIASDDANGLFHKAIAQSGYGTWPLPRNRYAAGPDPKDMAMGPAEKAEMLASEIVGRVSNAKQTRRMLYQLDGQQLVDSLVGFQVPIVDGVSLTEEPGIRFMRGEQNNVPLITGGNSYEGSVMPRSGISTGSYSAALGDNFNQARRLYSNDDATIWLKRMFGDSRYLLAARVLGDNMKHVSSNAWLYYIDFVPEAQKATSPGTNHGSDAYFIFRGHQSGDESVRELSERIKGYWLNFAYHGNPNGEGLVPWPVYEAETDTWLVFSDTDKSITGVIQEKLDLIESMYRQRTGFPQATARSK